jgi:hypothetical protein
MEERHCTPAKASNWSN